MPSNSPLSGISCGCCQSDGRVARLGMAIIAPHCGWLDFQGLACRTRFPLVGGQRNRRFWGSTLSLVNPLEPSHSRAKGARPGVLLDLPLLLLNARNAKWDLILCPTSMGVIGGRRGVRKSLNIGRPDRYRGRKGSGKLDLRHMRGVGTPQPRALASMGWGGSGAWELSGKSGG
jgi:hypothetical protein